MLQTCNWSKNNTMNMVEILRQLILSNKEPIKLGGRTDFLSWNGMIPLFELQEKRVADVILYASMLFDL